MRRYLRASGAAHGFFLGLDLVVAAAGARPGRRRQGTVGHPVPAVGALWGHRPLCAEPRRTPARPAQGDHLPRHAAQQGARAGAVARPVLPRPCARPLRGGDKVFALPDPAHPRARAAGQRRLGCFPAGRTGFLLFGYLAERKGPLAVLDALRTASARNCRAHRRVVRRAASIPRLRPELERRRLAVERERPGLWLRIDDRRLDRGELTALVRQSDVVLAPYQRFVGSSGVLLWAALNGRPVLAQDYGLVGRLTREHKLGLSVDACAPSKIGRGIGLMVTEGAGQFFDAQSALRFAAAQTPSRFASLVLSV